MAAWAKGVPHLLSLLQEGEEDDKDEEEEADSGLGEEEEELEVDVGDNEEPVELPREEEDVNEELTHVTLMYEVGSRSEAKVGQYETLDIESSARKHLDKNKERVDEARERVEREADERKDREDIVNFVREQEQAKIQSWVMQQTIIMDKKEEEEIYKDYRSPFIFRC